MVGEGSNRIGGYETPKQNKAEQNRTNKNLRDFVLPLIVKYFPELQ